MMRPVLESEYCNAYAHGLTISGQCKCILPCTDSMCVCENCRKSKDKTTEDMINFPKSGACLHHEVIAKALEEDKMKEMEYYFEKYKELEPKTYDDQLLDNYIKQVSDQQNQIGELQKTILELREQTKQHQKDLIKKDLQHILELGYWDNILPDSALNEIVDYILEKENK